MAYIYVIRNTINDKKYIGKTNFSVEKRFQEHLKDARRPRCEKRPLYNAINKYGAENFEASILEEVQESKADEAEIAWIEYYDTYGSNGYNATLGGSGKSYLDYEQILEVAQDESLSRVAVAEKCGCSPDSVSDVLKSHGIKVNWPQSTRHPCSKAVQMLDIETEEVLKEFPSQMDAGRYLIEHGRSQSKSAKDLSTKIGQVVRGKRKTAYGFKWRRIL